MKQVSKSLKNHPFNYGLLKVYDPYFKGNDTPVKVAPLMTALNRRVYPVK